MNKFLTWAIDKAQKEFVEYGEYEGKKYKATYKEFFGHMHPGRVRKLKDELGNTPVNEELQQVVCHWGGKYRSQAGNVRVNQVTYEYV